MEGGNLNVHRGHRLQPLAHLDRCLAGKGEREDLGLLHTAGADEVEDAVDEGERLAGAGRREDDERNIRRVGRRATLGVV